MYSMLWHQADSSMGLPYRPTLARSSEIRLCSSGSLRPVPSLSAGGLPWPDWVHFMQSRLHSQSSEESLRGKTKDSGLPRCLHFWVDIFLLILHQIIPILWQQLMLALPNSSLGERRKLRILFTRQQPVLLREVHFRLFVLLGILCKHTIEHARLP